MSALSGRPSVRIPVQGALLTVLGMALRGWPPTWLKLCDGLSLACLVFLMAAAWRFVMRQGSFTSLGYGMRKLREVIKTRDYQGARSSLPGLAEYRAAHRYEKSSRPYLIASVAAGVSAQLLWQLFGV